MNAVMESSNATKPVSSKSTLKDLFSRLNKRASNDVVSTKLACEDRKPLNSTESDDTEDLLDVSDTGKTLNFGVSALFNCIL